VEKSTTIENKIETFEEVLNSIIGICDEKIKHYKDFLEEYQQIKDAALSLLQLSNNTKRKVVSLINVLKKVEYRLYALMESGHED